MFGFVLFSPSCNRSLLTFQTPFRFFFSQFCFGSVRHEHARAAFFCFFHAAADALFLRRVLYDPSDGSRNIVSLLRYAWTSTVRFVENRHVTVFSKANGRGKLPGYAAPLAAALGESSTSRLLTPLQPSPRRGGRGSGSGGSRRRRRRYDGEHEGKNAAGPLSVAAASLRFVVTVVVAMADGEAATDEERRGREETVARMGAPGREEKGSREERGGSSADANATFFYETSAQTFEWRRQRATGGGDLDRLTRALWASGFLEACVFVLGEAPGDRERDRRRVSDAMGATDGGFTRNRWGELLSTSYDLEAFALRRAQANALALLRAVCLPVVLDSPSLFPAASPAAAKSDSAGGQGRTAEELFADRSADSSERPVEAIPDKRSSAVEDVDVRHSGHGALRRGFDGRGEIRGGRIGAMEDGGGSGGAAVPRGAADALTVRHALLTETPLLAGLVRCLVGVVEPSTVGPSGLQDGGDSGKCSARVAREVCATLGALLSADAYQTVATPFPTARGGGRSQRVSSCAGGRAAVHGVLHRDPRERNASGGAPDVVRASDLLSPGSAIPQAVFGALERVLGWTASCGSMGETVGVSQASVGRVRLVVRVCTGIV